jgi:hypothetical protein
MGERMVFMMKTIFVLLMASAVFAAGSPAEAAQDKVYTWIDDSGVIHYTNTAPPEGAVVIESEKELPHDAERARQRERRQERYLERLRQRQPPDETAAPAPAEEKKAAPEQAAAEDRPAETDQGRRNETWHQDRIEQRQRKQLY